MKFPKLTVLIGLMVLGSSTYVVAQENAVYEHYQPIHIKHEPGVTVQVLPWGTSTPSFLAEIQIVRGDTYTVWCAKPGFYLLNSGTGHLRIVEIKGEVEPEPDPDEPDEPDNPEPDPDIPEDEFDNVGRRANVWVKDQPQNDELAEIFSNFSREFLTSTDSINMIVDRFKNEVNSLIRDDGFYTLFRVEFSKDLNSRLPMTKQVWSDYFNAIAKGVGHDS